MNTVTGTRTEGTVTVTRDTYEDTYRTAQNMYDSGYETVTVNGVLVWNQNG